MSRDRIQPATGGPDAAAADRWGAGAGPDTASLPAGIDGVLIDGIADWLISSALGRVGVDAIFEGCCQRLHAAGARCEPLGAHSLRGVGAPVEVFAPC